MDDSWRPTHGPLSRHAPGILGHPPSVNASPLAATRRSMDDSIEDTGEVTDVYLERTGRFEWRIPDLSQLDPGDYASPTVNCFNMEWNLEMHKGWNGVEYVQLHRSIPRSVAAESIRFTIVSKTPDDEEMDITRDQTFPENPTLFNQKIYRPCYIASWGEVTLICTLRKDHSPQEGPLSRHAPMILGHRPPVNASPLADSRRSMVDSIQETGEVTDVYLERTGRFEWRIPDLSQLDPGDYTSPTVNCFNTEWDLEIHKGWNGLEYVHLHRSITRSVAAESIRFTIVSKTPYGGEMDIARDQTFPENPLLLNSKIYLPCSIPSWGEVTLTCTLRKDDSPQAEGPLSRHASRNLGHPPLVNASPLVDARRSIQDSFEDTCEVTDVCFERTARFEWRIPDSSELDPGDYTLPTVNCFNMEWDLKILKGWNGIEYVHLHRSITRSVAAESIRFTIVSKTPYGGEMDIARDQTFPENPLSLNQKIYLPCNIPSWGEVTFTCTLRKDDSPEAEGVSRETEDASCSNSRRDEHVNPGCKSVSCETQTEDPGLKGVSRETQTEDAHGRNDETHSKGISRETQTEGVSCSNDKRNEDVNSGFNGISRETQTDGSSSSDDKKDELMNPGFKGVARETQTEEAHGGNHEHQLEGISRQTQTESASCSNCGKDKQVNPGSKGVSRETQTEEPHGRNLEHHSSEGIPREAQKDGASCSKDKRDEQLNPGFKGISVERQTVGRYDEPHSEAISTLSDYFRNLLLSGDHHDLLIRVRGEEFRAHKCVLRIRSPVFVATFSSEMAESAQSSVTVDDCDPNAFGDFLHYVYTGEVDVASASSALGLYHAGHKFDFPRLKEMCVEFLKISFTTTTVFDVIHFAATHGEEELLQKAIVYFANNLEEVLLTVEWQRFLAANPVRANEMYLKAAQCLKTSL